MKADAAVHCNNELIRFATSPSQEPRPPCHIRTYVVWAHWDLHRHKGWIPAEKTPGACRSGDGCRSTRRRVPSTADRRCGPGRINPVDESMGTHDIRLVEESGSDLCPPLAGFIPPVVVCHYWGEGPCLRERNAPRKPFSTEGRVFAQGFRRIASLTLSSSIGPTREIGRGTRK